MNKERRERISDEVQKLLDRNSIAIPPIPVEQIVKSLGINLRFSPLDNELSGMIYIKDEMPIVGVNALHHPNRRRFTVAHECGHFVLHKNQITQEIHVDKIFPMLMRDSISAAGIKEIEIEANFFAAELLMPKTLLIKELGNESFDIDEEEVVGTLAEKFEVSQSAMRFRLGNLLLL